MSNAAGSDNTPGSNPVVPFLLGLAIGGLTGTVAGALLSRHTAHLVAALVGLIDRRLAGDDRDEVRFELLLQ